MEKRFVWVDGVQVQLTEAQLKFVASQNAKFAKEVNTFHKVLIHYGFKKVTDPHPNLKNCYQNSEHNWFAEIYHNNNRWVDVWLTGKLLPSMDAPPGGWMYGEISEIKEALDKALSNPKLWEL